MLIISRIFISVGTIEAVERNYIVIYSPKFYLNKISKRYSYINFIGYSFGFLIMALLLYIPDIGDQQDIIVYNKQNCYGWYAISFSFFLFILNIIFFTKETDENFEMIKDQINLKISINEEEPQKNLKKNKKFKNNNIDNILEKNDIIEKLIPDDKEKENENIINSINNDDEINENKNIENIENNENNGYNKIKVEEEPKENIDKLDENEEKRKNSNKSSISILNNNIDTGMNSSPVLSLKQKKLINKLESQLDEFNLKSNFTNINLIPKSIDDLIMKERYTFGYLKINLLLIFSLLFFSHLIKENMLFLYLYKLYENDELIYEYICLIFAGIFLFQLISFFFILPLKKINIFMKRYLIMFISATIIFISPLVYKPILNESFLVLSIVVLDITLFTNIITVLVSCYFSYLFPPRWNYLIGRSPIYVISAGKALGILLCLFIKVSFEFNFYFIFALCILIYGAIIGFLVRYKDLRIKIIARIIRKKAFEDKGI